MHQGWVSTLKHQVLIEKKKEVNKQISFSLGMVSSSLHRSAPTDPLPGLDEPGDDKGFKIIGNLWPWVWLAAKSRLVKWLYFVREVHWACFKLVLE